VSAYVRDGETWIGCDGGADCALYGASPSSVRPASRRPPPLLLPWRRRPSQDRKLSQADDHEAAVSACLICLVGQVIVLAGQRNPGVRNLGW
jgi:hypothetical protein